MVYTPYTMKGISIFRCNLEIRNSSIPLGCDEYQNFITLLKVKSVIDFYIICSLETPTAHGKDILQP